MHGHWSDIYVYFTAKGCYLLNTIELKKDQNSDSPSFTTQQSSFRLWKCASSSWKVVIEKNIFNSVCSENCNKPELLSGAESADSDCPDLLMELPVCT